MNPLPRGIVMAIGAAAGWLAATQPAAARMPAPRPLYRNLPIVKQVPASAGDDIDLSTIPVPVSADQAQGTFDARTAAAVLYSAISRSLDDVDVFLAKTAFVDYFDDTDQAYGFLRNQVNQTILERQPGQVWTTIDRDIDIDKGPIHIHLKGIHRPGEYDVDITAYLCLYYKYYDVLTPEARDHIFYDLLTQKGRFHPDQLNAYSVDAGVAVVTVPETENHILMIESSRYLTNQLWYQLTY